MLLKSSWATVTALSIFSSATKRVSSTRVQLLCTDGGRDHITRTHARRAALCLPTPGPRDARCLLLFMLVYRLCLADAEAGEGLDVHLAGLEDRLDGLLRFLHCRLLGEHHVLDEGTD